MWIAIIIVVTVGIAITGITTLRRAAHRAPLALSLSAIVPAALVPIAAVTSTWVTALVLALVAGTALGAGVGVRRAFHDRRLQPAERALFLAAGWTAQPGYPAHLGEMFTSPGKVLVVARPRTEWTDLATWVNLLPANSSEMQLVAVLEQPSTSTSTHSGRTVTLVTPANLAKITSRRATSARTSRRRPTDRPRSTRARPRPDQTKS